MSHKNCSVDHKLLIGYRKDGSMESIIQDINHDHRSEEENFSARVNDILIEYEHIQLSDDIIDDSYGSICRRDKFLSMHTSQVIIS